MAAASPPSSEPCRRRSSPNQDSRRLLRPRPDAAPQRPPASTRSSAVGISSLPPLPWRPQTPPRPGAPQEPWPPRLEATCSRRVRQSAIVAGEPLSIVDPDVLSGSSITPYLSPDLTSGNSSVQQLANTGTEVVCYESPRPVLGIHRLVFLLFQQLGRQTVYAPGWRQNFSTRDFTELYNLGLPVAAVYFNCQRESGTGGRRM